MIVNFCGISVKVSFSIKKSSRDSFSMKIYSNNKTNIRKIKKKLSLNDVSYLLICEKFVKEIVDTLRDGR